MCPQRKQHFSCMVCQQDKDKTPRLPAGMGGCEKIGRVIGGGGTNENECRKYVERGLLRRMGAWEGIGILG